MRRAYMCHTCILRVKRSKQINVDKTCRAHAVNKTRRPASCVQEVRMTRCHLLVMAIVTVAAVAVPSASDRVAVYGKIDRVVLEPRREAPETIQIWGVFSIAVRNNAND